MEFLFIFVANEEAGCLLSVMTSDFLSELADFRLRLSVFFFEEFVVLDGELSPVRLVVTEEVLGHEELHEAHINVVFHLPDPFAAPSHAKLRSDALSITCHHERQEGSLRHVR